MQAIRHRGACIARQARTSSLRQSASRRHASGHHSEPVNEPIGLGFWGAVAVVPASIFVYSISRTGEDGQAPWLTRKIQSYWDWQKTWEERNDLHTKAIEQAGFDRALFFHAPVDRTVDPKFPEIIHSHAARNIPAGHLTNLDYVVEHYKKKYHEEEDRKAGKS